MSDIKKLFSKKTTKTLSKTSLETAVSGGIESADFARSADKQIERFEPEVDFSDLSNFVRYGNAEQYYEDSIDYISGQYPYDGSLKEKIDWELSSSYFDKYVFENKYPRTNGFVTIGRNATTSSSDATGYATPSRTEYIYFKGGPHTASGGMIGEKLSKTFEKSNYYDTLKNRASNLELHGPGGITLEFWLHKQSFDSTVQSERQVICDIWNSGSWGSSDYGRLRVEVLGTSTTMDPEFHIELLSGSSGFSSAQINNPNPSIIMSASAITGSDWNHFALSFRNKGSQMNGKLYQNGGLVHSLDAGTTMDLVTGSMLGQIGSLITTVSGTLAARGRGLLSGSLDEFRFWKTERTPTQIGRNWFGQVGAGTNTDPANTELGVYYKFNEGIINTASINSLDAQVLDYSGRITNGVWTGYTAGARSTGSAMVISNASATEFKDPIIRTSNPLVSSFKSEKRLETTAFDAENNSGIYTTMPEWITSDPEELSGKNLKKLTQIVGSYFDHLHLQITSVKDIKNIEYVSGSSKPAPFTNRFLDSVGMISPEIFEDANALAHYASRDDYRKFAEKLDRTKNKIYQNVYNNLTYIYKSKGTEKAFRNLIRCFGVDEPLVKLNLYGDGATYELKENHRDSATRKNFVDFNDPDRFDATVYQQTASNDTTNTQNFIPGASLASAIQRPQTMQAEVIFPKKFKVDSSLYFPTNFLTSSLFGVHKPVADQADMTWASPDQANFQVQAVRTELESDDVYFQLTSSAGSLLIDKSSGNPVILTSSVFKDVYDNSKWNLAFRIRPEKPDSQLVTGSTNPDYIVDFFGYNSLADSVQNSFHVSASIITLYGAGFNSSNKRIYVGAEKLNFTGSTTIHKSDVKISSVRYWMSNLSKDAVEAHSKDPTAFGPVKPLESAFLIDDGLPYDESSPIPKIKTLALHWDFNQVTGSGPSSAPTVSDATFFVEDMSAEGSQPDSSKYGWVGTSTGLRHTGKGDYFLGNDTGSVNTEFLYTAKQLPPEVINSSDMIEVRNTDDDNLFTRNTRPLDYFYMIEKSPFAVISDEMIKIFATINDFNSLIGDPVNRYRQNYKDIDKLREIYFQNVGNDELDFEKFVEYFKWIDDSLSVMLMQLVPASANFSENVRMMIESHVLERNKYWNKLPTMEFKTPEPEGGLRGINEMLYPYRLGSAPIQNSNTGSNCFWWNNRAERDGANITSGDSNVDIQRGTIRDAKNFRSGSGPTLSTVASTQYEGSAYALRNFTKPYRLVVDEAKEIHGGSNHPRSKKLDYAHTQLKSNGLGSTDINLRVTASAINKEVDCNDVVDPNKKERLEGALVSDQNTSGFYDASNNYEGGKSSMFAPFSLFSSSHSPAYLSAFRSNTQIANYHDDSYGNEGEIPVQGPFTNAHVGGRQHRHVDINSSATDTILTRAEAWDLDVDSSGYIGITSRRANLNKPRATMLRDGIAKRAVNIKNIQWGTGSNVAGNYRFGYEVVQTSGRKLNNRHFVKTEGAVPVTASSAFLSDYKDYILPRNDLTGSNKSIFVERFNAPGGADVSSRGVLDVESEEYAIRNNLNYRNSVVRDSLHEWYTEHSEKFGIKSGSSIRADDYATNASYHKVNRNPLTIALLTEGFVGDETCSVKYNNWYVQNAIPRSDYQYNWVTSSADKEGCTIFGHVGSGDCGKTNFTVPSGDTESVAGPSVAYISASDAGAGGIRVDFAGLNTLVYDPVISNSNLLSASESEYRNTDIATLNTSASLNSLLLHRNGPYQHPSWKQIRGGESPIVRLQKKSNVMTFKKEESILEDNKTAPSNAGLTRDTLLRVTEPPVSFRGKPLVIGLKMKDSDQPVTINSSYANNLVSFANPSVNNFLGKSIKCKEQMFDRIKELYLDAPEDSPVESLISLKYNEVIYPREVNVGIKQTRQRTQFAEVASGTLNPDGTFSASVSDGINGIDRQPLERRTFWRDNAIFRNRRSGFQEMIGAIGFSGIFTGTLPNSQGHFDGFATSVNGWGNLPVVFMKPGDSGFTFNKSPGESDSFSGSLNTGPVPSYSNYKDGGELNSANYQTIGGYMGRPEGSAATDRIGYLTTFFPTASCYYYHRQHHRGFSSIAPGSNGSVKWRVAELSGKNPWYDSYEDYADNMRSITKDFSIIPEFRISQHMPYYVGGKFKKPNRKFLTLDGAEVTSSAETEASPFFNKRFFEEYSNADFQKYFGKFNTDHKVDSVSLRCNAVKKLLPYQGFYPSHRTLQLASMFSQSIAPYIGGLEWQRGEKKSSALAGEPSGALAVQSLLQPYFAPGIMYNTIKSGIACDWAAYSGSFDFTTTGSVEIGWLDEQSNYRIPFESILSPLENVGLPPSSSDGEGKVLLLYPSYNVSAHVGSTPAFNPPNSNGRQPFVDLEDEQRAIAMESDEYSLYKLAMSNFMAEVPSFFMNKKQMSSIVSSPAEEGKLENGTTYYMNIFLQKSPNLVMFEDYWNGSRGGTGTALNEGPAPEPLVSGNTHRSFNGKYFGPPVQAGDPERNGGFRWSNAFAPSGFESTMGDPAYAPYTPPYFYGKSIATVEYTADLDDAKGGFSFKKLFDAANITFSNPQLDNMFELLGNGYNAASSGSMKISSSVNLFGLFQEKEVIYDESGRAQQVVDDPNSVKNRWVISPKMETPVLDFSSQPEEYGYGRGMWSGYGVTSSQGISFGIEDTYKGAVAEGTGSLIDVFFKSSSREQQVGQLAEQKVISEAIVAIPFATKAFRKDSKFARTTTVIGKNFFAIDEDKFQIYRDVLIRNENSDVKTSPEAPSFSIQKMLEVMNDYVIPPELDFLTFNKGSQKVKPFVMYMFEFNHTLDSEDLGDIWQGVMPKIARIPKLSNDDEDDNVFEHPMGENEFFGGKEMPEDIRWMVFKVKKKAEKDYFKITADTTDDDRFRFDFKVGGVDLPYSYNWPYDYFSLVELAQIEAEDTFVVRDEEE